MSKTSDALGAIDGKIIDEALNIDSQTEMMIAVANEKRKRGFKVLRIISAVAACACICVCAFALYKHQNPGDNGNTQVKSPMTYVSSIEEMNKALGFDVPKLSSKEVTSFIVYSTDTKTADMGRLVYSDGSEFRMSRSKGDISGVFGGKQDGEAVIASVKVRYYVMSEIHYALWNVNGYTFCYYASESEVDYSGIIEELIKNTI